MKDGGKGLRVEADHEIRISKAFQEVALQLAGEPEVDKILATIIERAMLLTGATYAAAATVGPSEEINLFVHRGLSDAQAATLPHPPEGKGLLGLVLAGSQTVRVDRMSDHEASVGFPSPHVPMEAFLGVPISHHGMTSGAIFLTKAPDAAPFGASDEETVTALAALAAVGVGNALSLQRERTRLELNDSLRRVGDAVKDSLDLSEVLATTVEELGRIASVDRCYIRMVDAPGSSKLGPIEFEWGREGMEPLAAGTDMQYPVANMAALTRTTQWSDDVANDPRLRDPDIPGAPLHQLPNDAAAVLAAPLEWGQELLGVVTLHSERPRHWSDDDVTLIELAAREVSSAVHHARLYEEALETVRGLRDLEQRRGEYIAMVSHEIRSPMTVVAGIADILEKKRHRLPDEAITDLVDSLGREARRLSRLVNEVLDIERIDRGGMMLNKQDVDVVEIAREAIADTGETGRTLFAARTDRAPVHADRDKVKQVFINLISNAVKFAPDNTPVTVSVATARQHVTVGIRDEGPGISAQDKERLFQRFSRLDGTSEKPGTGLGLYLSRLIVERHDGRIWVDSEPGRGTTFYFELPLSEGDAG